MAGDLIRDAFEKIKSEINFLKSEIFLLKNDLHAVKKDSESNKIQIDALKSQNSEIAFMLGSLNSGMSELNSALKEAVLYINSRTSSAYPQYSGTSHAKNEADKPYLAFSIGNAGVPTLPQQTNTQSNTSPAHDFTNKLQHIQDQETFNEHRELKRTSIKELVASLKADLKSKFKSLTKQEFYVFSTMYTLEQELGKPLTYRDIALKTGLTDSTIRDYIARLMAKGIPVSKEKSNNKDILLRISEELRNLATLDNLSSIKSNDFH